MRPYSPSRYRLNPDRSVSPVEDLMEWARYYESGNDRVVGQATILGVFISTVFLALDHQWDKGPPLLFETMVFRGRFDQSQYGVHGMRPNEAMPRSCSSSGDRGCRSLSGSSQGWSD